MRVGAVCDEHAHHLDVAIDDGAVQRANEVRALVRELGSQAQHRADTTPIARADGGGEALDGRYLYNLGPILKERAFEYKHARDAAPPGWDERAFLSRQVVAFNEVISILQQQADGFQIGRQNCAWRMLSLIAILHSSTLPSSRCT